MDKLLTQEDLPADGVLTYLALVVEDDGFLGAFLAGLVAIGVATAIARSSEFPSNPRHRVSATVCLREEERSE